MAVPFDSAKNNANSVFNILGLLVGLFVVQNATQTMAWLDVRYYITLTT